MTKAIRVYVIEDNPVLRKAVATALKQAKDIQAVATPCTTTDASTTS